MSDINRESELSEDERNEILMDMESGTADFVDAIRAFSSLMKNGCLHKLGYKYVESAQNLINKRILDNNGNINWNKFDEITKPNFKDRINGN